jgi:hypothetical protein
VRFSGVARDAWRLLTFRPPSPAIASSWPGYLAFGLACTWIAGIGRYWDNPRAESWQHFGLGSLAYVFLLAALLWLVMLPLRPKRWSYRSVLVFVTLTSPPAILYAIPVERFLPLDAAQQANAIFLGVVATWRVALLAWFLRKVADLDWLAIVVGTLLPLVLIVVALTLLNLEHVVFNIMAGISPDERSGNDGAYLVVMAFAAYSAMAFPVLVLAYLGLVVRAMAAGRRQKRVPIQDAPGVD